MQPLNMMQGLPQTGVSSMSLGATGANPMAAMSTPGATAQSMPGMASFGGSAQTTDPNQMMMQMMGMMAMMMMGMMQMMMQLMGGAQGAQGNGGTASGVAGPTVNSLAQNAEARTGEFDGNTSFGAGVSGAVANNKDRLAGLDFQQDYQNDCGLATIANVGKLQGKNISEQDVVAFAKQSGLGNPDGSTTPADREAIAKHFGINLGTKNNANISDLANAAGSGKPAIIAVNNEAISPNSGKSGGELNHVVTLAGVKRGEGGQVEGFYIVDTSSGDADGVRFVSANQMRNATNGGNTYLQTAA